jgi:hypothetical protein
MTADEVLEMLDVVDDLSRETLIDEDELLVLEDCEVLRTVDVLVGLCKVTETATEDEELHTAVEDSDPQRLTFHDTVCCTHETPGSEVGKFGIGIVGQMDKDIATVASEQCA